MAQDVSFLGELFKTVGSGLEERRKQKGTPLDIFELMLKQKQIEAYNENLKDIASKREQERLGLERAGRIVSPGSIESRELENIGTGLPYSEAFDIYKLRKTAEMAKEKQDAKAQELPTATKTMMDAAPKVLSFVSELKPIINRNVSQLGPQAGRWNEFMVGKVGAPNKEFAKLRTKMGLLTTLLMRMHVGARGGEYAMEHFKGLMDAGKASPENLNASLEAVQDYANDLIDQANKAGYKLPGKMMGNKLGPLDLDKTNNDPLGLGF